MLGASSRGRDPLQSGRFRWASAPAHPAAPRPGWHIDGDQAFAVRLSRDTEANRNIGVYQNVTSAKPTGPLEVAAKRRKNAAHGAAVGVRRATQVSPEGAKECRADF